MHLRLLGVVSHIPAGILNEACSLMSFTETELSAARVSSEAFIV